MPPVCIGGRAWTRFHFFPGTGSITILLMNDTAGLGEDRVMSIGVAIEEGRGRQLLIRSELGSNTACYSTNVAWM